MKGVILMKKMIIKGVGSFLAKRWNAALNGFEILTLGTLQSLKITFNVEIDDIFGGDGIFAIDTLIKSKSIEVTATDAKFDLNALTLMMGDGEAGSTKDSDKYTWAQNEQVIIGGESREVSKVTVIETPSEAGSCTLTFGSVVGTIALNGSETEQTMATKIAANSNLLAAYDISVNSDVITFTCKTVGNTASPVFAAGTATGAAVIAETIVGGQGTTKTATTLYVPFSTPDFSIRNKDTNALMTLVGSNPTAGQYSVSGSVVTFGDADGTVVIMNYKKADASVEVYAVLSDAFPFSVHVIHNGAFLQKDNSKAGVETELYMCRAKGAFTIDATRATASASEIALTVLDPERSDRRLGTVKRFTL
jgi:hypothetical protein